MWNDFVSSLMRYTFGAFPPGRTYEQPYIYSSMYLSEDLFLKFHMYDGVLSEEAMSILTWSYSL